VRGTRRIPSLTEETVGTMRSLGEDDRIVAAYGTPAAAPEPILASCCFDKGRAERIAARPG